MVEASVMTDPAAMPAPPLLDRLWPRLTEWLSRRPARPEHFGLAMALGCFIAFTVPAAAGAGSAQQAGADAAFGALAGQRWWSAPVGPVPVVLAVTAVGVRGRDPGGRVVYPVHRAIQAPTWSSRSSPPPTAAAGGGRCGRPR